MTDTLVLFAHGARDPRWAEPLERLAALLRARQPGLRVTPAFLEFMSPSLPEAIDAAVAHGARHIRVVPVFLAAGGHVKRDLPDMLAAARARHPAVALDQAPVLGEDAGVLAAMAEAALAP